MAPITCSFLTPSGTYTSPLVNPTEEEEQAASPSPKTIKISMTKPVSSSPLIVFTLPYLSYNTHVLYKPLLGFPTSLSWFHID